jgi:predicted dehydrogenase
MVGFAVVGLGMGRNRARLINETEGAELRVVCDQRGDLAEEVAQVRIVPCTWIMCWHVTMWTWSK